VRRKLAYFLAILVPVIVLDLATKSWALEALATRRGELLGGLVPLTLAFNKGAAFGISIGDDSRWFFVPVTLVALVLLGVLLRQAERSDHLRIVAVSLVVSGALGNLWDRVRWDRGVVDFLGPIDLGFWDFPIFNVADMAITCGAILLALSFWMEERALVAAEEEAGRVEAARSMDEAADEAGSSALVDRGRAEPRSVEPVSRDRRSEV
jgi:signal peptidase II